MEHTDGGPCNCRACVVVEEMRVSSAKQQLALARLNAINVKRLASQKEVDRWVNLMDHVQRANYTHVGLLNSAMDQYEAEL